MKQALGIVLLAVIGFVIYSLFSKKGTAATPFLIGNSSPKNPTALAASSASATMLSPTAWLGGGSPSILNLVPIDSTDIQSSDSIVNMPAPTAPAGVIYD